MDQKMLFPVFVSSIGLLMLIVNEILYLKHIKGKDKLYRIITYYLAGLIVVEISCNIIGSLQPNSNFYLSHFFFNFQFLVLSFFFYYFFEKKLIKRIILFTYLVISSIIIWQYIDNQELFWIFNTFEVISISFILISLSLLAIYKMLEENSPQYYNFFIGLIVYFLPSSMIFLSGNFELTFIEKPLLIDIWIFNSLGFIIYQYFVFREWKVLTNKV